MRIIINPLLLLLLLLLFRTSVERNVGTKYPNADHLEGWWMISWTGVVVHCWKWCGWWQTGKSGEVSSLASTAHRDHELEEEEEEEEDSNVVSS